MNPAAAKRFRILASVVSVLVVLILATLGWFYIKLRASLPQIDGRHAVPRLQAYVAVTRDRLGIPTIHGENRLDVARALGWTHAQDRFFQMDLLRRRGAGELAALVGPAALPLDRFTRKHGFRELAGRIVPQLGATERALIEAYTDGVNAGLAALGGPPFEYIILRETPQPWKPEDSVLVGCAMLLDFQGDDGAYERSLMTLRDTLGLDAVDFFAPLATPHDAAIDGSTAALRPIPSPRMLDLRGHPTTARRVPEKFAAANSNINIYIPRAADGAQLGSNNFALTGAHTASGAALVANDMHLGLSVPNTWYRASLEWPGHRVTGVTLPGTPITVVGSNGSVAWALTNAYADVSDIVVVDLNPISPTIYTVPGRSDLVHIENRHATIAVHGAKPEEVDYEWTVWGPVVGHNARGQPLVLRWVAQEPGALNFILAEMENATNIDQAIDVAHRAGMPATNILVGDRTGAIAWTIAGRLPKRVGFDGRLPVSWSFGDRRWDGLRDPAEIPVVRFSNTAAGGGSATTASTTHATVANVTAAPAENDGRLWSANQRVLGGASGAIIGDGGSARPARAAQIRDDLAHVEHARPADFLNIQLDDRAVFLERWHQLLLNTLTPEIVGRKKNRGELRQLAEKWEGRSSVDSVSYTLTRTFRDAVMRRVFTPIFAGCVDANPDFSYIQFHYEDALWALVHEKPAHLLDPQYESWDALLVAAADDVIARADEQHEPLARATWGRRNTARIWHPLSRALPHFLTGWMNLPADELPGDVDMPRVQAPAFGASERMSVSPGREDEGILEMPGGQSGHPLSDFYRAGHESWVRGEATPFLPGPAQHTLTLVP